jgi:hypothetical protein
MKQYKLINLGLGIIVFFISLWQYSSTAESAGSLWDCGEFISCAYKLQVAHPPGAPLFMLIGRFFSLFAKDQSQVAFMLNIMSAFMSAACVMFLFWIITILSKRIIAPKKEDLTLDRVISIMGAGLVGSLACSFMDTMWFSAVEGEVYASSMFFISITFWAVMKWDEQADEPHANRWLVFACFMIGLSLGVHLLSLLVIPAAALVYYFRRYEPTILGFFVAFFVGFVILGLVQVGVVQFVPKIASYFEMFFVNTLRLPFNSGLVFGGILLFVLTILLLRYANKIKHADLQLTAICALVIFIGFSTYIMVPIRAAANPPINMNAPKDAFSLISYLNREQYGDRPLLKGPMFTAQPYELENKGNVYFPNEKTKKYEVKDIKRAYKYKEEDMLFFPRMGPTNDGANAGQLFQYWTDFQGTPTFSDNLSYFFKYQLGHMYWRYFMWNFSGRQDDYQGMAGTNLTNGNWLSGISAIDDARLGSQKNLPYQIENQKARNKFYLLPLILGLIGLFYMLKLNPNYTLIVTLLFLTTGMLLIVYQNSPPREPRERDYALVGSFFTFCIWIGFAVIAVSELVREKMRSIALSVSLATSILFLGVPYIMAKEGWDDHNRHDRYMARDFAINYLESCPPNAILFTQGDNDTYPLWYAQEVEGIRTDVRIVNLSLLGVDWYIDGLHKPANKAGALPFYKDFTSDKYRGSNRQILSYNAQSGLADPNSYYDLDKILTFVLSDDPKYKAQTQQGEVVSYFPSTKFKIKVDKAVVLKNNIVPAQYQDRIVDEIVWDLGKDRVIIYDLAVLALVAGADWSRPICFANTVESTYYQGLEKYMIQEGLVNRIVPLRFEENQRGYTTMNTEKNIDLINNKFKYGGLGEREMFIDENSARIMNTLKSVHFAIADDLIRNNKKEEAIKVLDKAKKEFQYVNAPYYAPNNRFFNILSVQWIELYYRADAKDKATEIKKLHIKDLADCLRFYNSGSTSALRYTEEKKTAEDLVKRMEYIATNYKDNEFMAELNKNFPTLVQSNSVDINAVAPQQIFR